MARLPLQGWRRIVLIVPFIAIGPAFALAFFVLASLLGPLLRGASSPSLVGALNFYLMALPASYLIAGVPLFMTGAVFAFLPAAMLASWTRWLTVTALGLLAGLAWTTINARETDYFHGWDFNLSIAVVIALAAACSLIAYEQLSRVVLRRRS